MDPSFKKWLCEQHNAPPKLLKKLEREDITSKITLSALTDTDLGTLEKKHKLPMGHMVILRSSRDELLQARANGGGEKIRSRSRHDDSFVVLEAPVQRETVQGTAAAPSYPARLEDQQWQRPTGNEIRSKYQLPGGGPRGGRYAPAAPRNGASAMPSATPSPLPDTARTPTPAGGATGGGLQTAAQMRELHQKGVERGEKILVLEQKSRGLASTAMDYESICAQLADTQKVGVKKKKNKQNKKDKDAMQAATTEDKRAATTLPQPHSERERMSSSTPHLLPPHSPSTLPSSPPPHTPTQGPQSDPIRHRSPHHHHHQSYGTIDIDRDRSRSATPTMFSYTSDDEELHLHYEEEEESDKPTNDRGRSRCPCCRTM